MAAARHWAGARAQRPAVRPMLDEGLLEGMRRMGASEQDVAAARVQMLAQRERMSLAQQVTDADAFEVWPENWESVMFFVAVETQWAYVGVGLAGAVRTGLPSHRLEAEMNLRRVPPRRRVALLDDVRVMERAVLRFDRERAQA